jgi:hypothetical protein
VATSIDGLAGQREVLDRVLNLRKRAVAALSRDAVPVYLFLAERFKSTSDIRSDCVFQFLFRSFYRLDNAGLTDEFKAAYFDHLQRHRRGPIPVPNPLRLLRHLCERFAAYETKKGKKALQFSFATKLLATIDPQQPVYDPFVASLFGFKRPDHVKDRSRRLERLLQFYELLIQTSQLLREQEWFGTVSAAFARYYPGWHNVPPTKQVDSRDSAGKKYPKL